MSIRMQFQGRVDEFLADLDMFARGSYLREEEKTYWEPPFDPAAVGEVRAAIEATLEAFDALGTAPEATTLRGSGAQLESSLRAVNARHADAVIEPEERAWIADLLRDAALAAGADEAVVSEFLEELDAGWEEHED